jgi:hypothetical protein
MMMITTFLPSSSFFFSLKSSVEFIQLSHLHLISGAHFSQKVRDIASRSVGGELKKQKAKSKKSTGVIVMKRLHVNS